MLYIKRSRLKACWMGGWMEGKAGFRIAYSNQKPEYSEWETEQVGFFNKRLQKHFHEKQGGAVGKHQPFPYLKLFALIIKFC
jgi:hypothetical protein